MIGSRFWRSVSAGLCGSAAHSGLMAFKAWAGLLPSFQPYEDLQSALAGLLGSAVHPAAIWALSYFNGSVVLSFVFGYAYRHLPGRSGASKGASFGLLMWVVMGLLFFPALGKGFFATQTSLGLAPTLFSLAMVLTYSVMLGLTYAAFQLERPRRDA